MIQPCGARRWRCSATAFPGIQPDMMMVASRRDKRGIFPISLYQFKAKHSAVKPERTFQVGDLEVNMPDACTGINRWLCSRDRFRLHNLFTCYKATPFLFLQLALNKYSLNIMLGSETEIVVARLAFEVLFADKRTEQLFQSPHRIAGKYQHNDERVIFDSCFLQPGDIRLGKPFLPHEAAQHRDYG